MDINEIGIEPLSFIHELSNATCRALYSYWGSLLNGVESEISDLVELPHVLPWLVVIDVEGDGETFRFRLVGSEVVSLTGHDLTGEIVDRSGQEAPLSLRFCEAIANAKAAVHTSDSFEGEYKGVTHRLEETVALPLFNGQGALDRILLLHGPRVVASRNYLPQCH